MIDCIQFVDNIRQYLILFYLIKFLLGYIIYYDRQKDRDIGS
jgi:hypothetical protein